MDQHESAAMDPQQHARVFCRTHISHAQQQVRSKQWIQTLLLACNTGSALCMLRMQINFHFV